MFPVFLVVVFSSLATVPEVDKESSKIQLSVYDAAHNLGTDETRPDFETLS